MMNLVQRAHIFSSYDALKGFRQMLKAQEKTVVEKRIISEDEIDELNRNVMKLEKGMFISVEYRQGHEILCKKGVLSRVNITLHEIQIVKTKIDLKQVIWLEIEDKY